MRPWILRSDKDKTNLRNADNFLYDILNWVKYYKDYIELLKELKIDYITNGQLNDAFSERLRLGLDFYLHSEPILTALAENEVKINIIMTKV